MRHEQSQKFIKFIHGYLGHWRKNINSRVWYLSLNIFYTSRLKLFNSGFKSKHVCVHSLKVRYKLTLLWENSVLGRVIIIYCLMMLFITIYWLMMLFIIIYCLMMLFITIYWLMMLLLLFHSASLLSHNTTSHNIE